MAVRFPDGKGGKKEIIDRSMLKEREEIFKSVNSMNGSHFATDATTLKIPSSVKSVTAGAFLECPNLKEVDYSDIDSDTVTVSNINRFCNYKVETGGGTCEAIPAIIVGDKHLVLEASIEKDPLKEVSDRTNFNNDFFIDKVTGAFLPETKLRQWIVCDDVIYFFDGFKYMNSVTASLETGPLLIWQIISEKPEDWDTNTNLYFKVENHRPVRLEQGVAWESGKYFEYISASLLGEINPALMMPVTDAADIVQPYYFYEKIGDKFQHIYTVPDENWNQNYTDEYLSNVYYYENR